MSWAKLPLTNKALLSLRNKCYWPLLRCRSLLKLRFQEYMKKTTKASTFKEKICAHCMLKETCGDLPGLCMLLYYALIASVIVGLSYLLITMKL